MFSINNHIHGRGGSGFLFFVPFYLRIWGLDCFEVVIVPIPVGRVGSFLPLFVN